MGASAGRAAQDLRAHRHRPDARKARPACACSTATARAPSSASSWTTWCAAGHGAAGQPAGRGRALQPACGPGGHARDTNADYILQIAEGWDLTKSSTGPAWCSCATSCRVPRWPSSSSTAPRPPRAGWELIEAARAAWTDDDKARRLRLSDGDYDELRGLAENWASWSLFVEMSGQWRIGGMGGSALDYAAVFMRMERMRLTTTPGSSCSPTCALSSAPCSM